MRIAAIGKATIVVTGFFAASCLPMGPKKACKQGFEAGCRQLKKCNRAAFDRAFSGIGDCIDSFERLGLDCSEVDKADVCSDPKDYDPFKAGACVRAQRARDCGDDLLPDVCNDVCN